MTIEEYFPLNQFSTELEGLSVDTLDAFDAIMSDIRNDIIQIKNK